LYFFLLRQLFGSIRSFPSRPSPLHLFSLPRSLPLRLSAKDFCSLGLNTGLGHGLGDLEFPTILHLRRRDYHSLVIRPFLSDPPSPRSSAIRPVFCLTAPSRQSQRFNNAPGQSLPPEILFIRVPPFPFPSAPYTPFFYGVRD